MNHVLDRAVRALVVLAVIAVLADVFLIPIDRIPFRDAYALYTLRLLILVSAAVGLPLWLVLWLWDTVSKRQGVKRRGVRGKGEGVELPGQVWPPPIDPPPGPPQ